MTKLALLGGAPEIAGPLPRYPSMGPGELAAVREVVESGSLSGFYGSPGPEFVGGPKVRAFEAAWRDHFRTRHAISVNSATSGLYSACAAAGIGPGDEVIVPPYTMSATVMAPLLYGGIPVFADVEDETFCLDVDAVRRAITSKTRAVIAVNLFGHPASLAELRALADERDLVLIEDNAQGPLAREGDRYAGTIGHMGVFSFNYHKHIHTGEGGMVVTDDDAFAIRLQAVRNHAENVVEDFGLTAAPNMIGFNFRMTELSAAVGLVQLTESERHVGRRIAIAERLSERLGNLEGVRVPSVRSGCRHVYYTWAARLDERALGVSRDLFCRALEAEGFPIAQGYVRPLYLLPIFQNRLGVGRDGFPFTLTDRVYEKGLSPVTERLHERELMFFETCAFDLGNDDVDRLAAAFHKVHAGRAQLRETERP